VAIVFFCVFAFYEAEGNDTDYAFFFFLVLLGCLTKRNVKGEFRFISRRVATSIFMLFCFFYVRTVLGRMTGMQIRIWFLFDMCA